MFSSIRVRYEETNCSEVTWPVSSSVRRSETVAVRKSIDVALAYIEIRKAKDNNTMHFGRIVSPAVTAPGDCIEADGNR